MNIVPNMNDMWTANHGPQKVYQGHSTLLTGRVIQVTRDSHLGQVYNVELLDSGAVIRGCRLATGETGFNGVGETKPLEEGTPVTIMPKNGMLQESFIVGAFNTEGKYDAFYEEGELQPPGETIRGVEYNQPLGHPNRITQEDSYFRTMGGKTIASAYDSPEFHTELEDQIKARPLPSSIEMRNQGGDIVSYTLGTNVIYSDNNIIQVSAGNREEKTAKLLRFANMHSKRSQLLSGNQTAAPTTTDQEPPTTETGLIPVVSNSTLTDTNEAIPVNYRVEQEQKLAELYMQAGNVQNQMTAARLEEANRLQESFGSELSTNPNDGNTVAPNFTPTIETVRTNSNNFSNRESTDAAGNELDNDLLVVIHETGASSADTIRAMQDSSTRASYHVLIKQDGTVVELVAPNQRAFGAGNSDFNGEAVTLAGQRPSVDNFAYHVALESGDNNSYTEEQYRSLAYVVSRTGAPNERITTHSSIDRTGSRSDPHSFEDTRFRRLLNAYPRQRQINFGEEL